MNIVQITPGAGAMYCGNCLRDNALVRELRARGDDVLMVPVYLPLTLDEPDESHQTPVFFSGINVYLDQTLPWNKAPHFLRRMLASKPLLRWAGARAAKTRAEELGELTLSMLRGEQGRQARELDELIGWLRTQPRPAVLCLSNVLLAGMVRGLKQSLNVPVVCMLQGEDAFLDALPPSHREACWSLLRERAAEVDLFVATSKYFATLMSKRLAIPPERIRVVYNGIDLSAYQAHSSGTLLPQSESPVLGYFARMCPEKGLDLVVDAFILLRQRQPDSKLRLRIGGSCGPSDEPFVKTLRGRLAAQNLLAATEFFPNLSHAEKVRFLRSLTLFSVPARANEAFGLYLIEALAAGVPVIQPRFAAFPELIEQTGGGILFDPQTAAALADAVQELISNPDRGRKLGESGRAVVTQKFSAATMADGMREVFGSVVK